MIFKEMRYFLWKPIGEVRSVRKREITADHSFLSLYAILVSDHGEHVGTFIGNVDCSRDQISLKLGGTSGGDDQGTAGCGAAFGLGRPWYNIANGEKMCKPHPRNIIVCGAESGHGGGGQR